MRNIYGINVNIILQYLWFIAHSCIDTNGYNKYRYVMVIFYGKIIMGIYHVIHE